MPWAEFLTLAPGTPLIVHAVELLTIAAPETPPRPSTAGVRTRADRFLRSLKKTQAWLDTAVVLALSLKLSALVAPECAGVLQSVTRARADPALPFTALPRLRLVTQAGTLAFFHPHLGAAGRRHGARGRMPPGSVCVG